MLNNRLFPLLFTGLLLGGCEGDDGSTGPAGPAGDQGDPGAMFQAFINGTEPFLSADDVLIAVLESIAVQAEFIADRKIAPALRGGDASGLAKRTVRRQTHANLA